jgi:peptidoglycan/LPS O-acetylase OafA/YrhL
LKNISVNRPVRHWLEPWHVDPSANRSYDFIDGLRGIAILMVLATHSFYAREHQDLAVRYVLCFKDNLGRGVDLFFTLSGFLISWPFWKRKASHAEQLIPPGYGWRRFWKIYPPLALSVLLLTPFYILSYGQASAYLHTAVQWLTGLAFVIPASGRFNPVMWSLVVEIHFYLVLPLLFLLTKPLSARACLWIIPLFLFAVPVTIQALTGLAPTFTPKVSDPFCVGLSCFCFGVAVAGIDALKLWDGRWVKFGEAGWFAMLAGLAGMAWTQMDPSVDYKILAALSHWTYTLGTGCLLCYAAAPENPRARRLCAPWLRWCGIISYEWYLFHQPLIEWTRVLFGPTGGNIFTYSLIIVIGLVASVTLSALVYRKYSLPILKFGRSKNRRAN